jgi:hypothetical protein
MGVIIPPACRASKDTDAQESRSGPMRGAIGLARHGFIDRCHKPQMRNLRRTDTPTQLALVDVSAVM